MLAFLLAFLFLCFVPDVLADGDFAWHWGADGESCTAACNDKGLTCVNKFYNIKDEAAFDAVKGAVSCERYRFYASTKQRVSF